MKDGVEFLCWIPLPNDLWENDLASIHVNIWMKYPTVIVDVRTMSKVHARNEYFGPELDGLKSSMERLDIEFYD